MRPCRFSTRRRRRNKPDQKVPLVDVFGKFPEQVYGKTGTAPAAAPAARQIARGRG